MGSINSELKQRIPLIKSENLKMLKFISEHPHAPFWNYQCGDRIQSKDIPFIEEFTQKVYNERIKMLEPSDSIMEWLKSIQSSSRFFASRLKYISNKEQFFYIPVTTRKDLAENLSQIIPYTEDLSRLVVNPTSGTTGHSIACPNHPKSVACYNPLIKYSIEKHGNQLNFHKDCVAALQIYFQKNTAVYHTVKPILNGAGFAKLNLNHSSWKQTDSAEKFINDMNPLFLSGNPVGFAELLQYNLSFEPKAILSTSLAMSPVLRKQLETKFHTRVVDFYSLNDTGPIGYSCPHNPDWFHVLAPDIFLEITDNEGNSLKPGEIGNITVTGGRNPYLPLVRYQTGDTGKIDISDCSCQETTIKFQLYDMRKPVLFQVPGFQPINPIDISRIIRRFPLYQHQFIQIEKDRFQLKLKEMPIFSNSDLQNLEQELKNLFGTNIQLHISFDLKGDDKSGKVNPYINLFQPE